MGIRHTYYRLKHFYNGLSNRILGIILLIVIILTFYFLYWYIFVYSLFNVELKANIDDYKVKFYSTRIAKTFDYSCENKDCNLEKISALDYDVTISKEGYEDFKFKFNPKVENQLSFEMTKIIILKPIKKQKIQSKNFSREEKIKLLKNKNKHYLVFNNKEKEIFFDINGSVLDVSFDGNIIFSSEKVPKNEIYVIGVINSKKYLILVIGKNKYILHTDFLTVNKLNLNLDISYAKIISNSKMLFITIKGSFLYDTKTNKMTYFNNLYDFIILDDGNYIGILKDSVLSQKKNLNLQKEKGDLIVLIDKLNKTTKILKRIHSNISKIYKKDESIYIVDDDDNIFEFLNYK